MVSAYFAAGIQAQGELSFRGRASEAPASEFIRLIAVRNRSGCGDATSSIDARSPLGIEVEYEILRPAANLRIGIQLTSHDGIILFSTTTSDAASDDPQELRAPGTYLSTCTIPGNFLNYGQYFLSVGCDTPLIQTHFLVERAISFTVEQTGGVAGHISDGRRGFLRLALPWTTHGLV
jgi:lipopolysaccharide transport system ATP-binding protein